MAEGPGHRALVGLFGQHPGTIFSILKLKDYETKGYTAECGSENLSSSRTADNILKFKNRQGRLALALIVDTQRRKDHDVKRWTWAQYYYTLHVILKKKHPQCAIKKRDVPQPSGWGFRAAAGEAGFPDINLPGTE